MKATLCGIAKFIDAKHLDELKEVEAKVARFAESHIPIFCAEALSRALLQLRPVVQLLAVFDASQNYRTPEGRRHSQDGPEDP